MSAFTLASFRYPRLWDRVVNRSHMINNLLNSRYAAISICSTVCSPKRVTAHGFSVINGAQTLGSIAECFRNPPAPAPDGCAFLKLISLEKCEDDRAFAERITRSANFQNQVGSREFVALDAQQEATNFSLDEATTACACLAQLVDCDYCARTLANRKSLWLMADTYPAGDQPRSIYARVFRAERSARTVWRAVQAQRLVIKVMQDSMRASTGVRRAFFENARWLVLNVLFLRLHPQQGEDLTIGAIEVANVSRVALELAEALWTVCETKGFVSRRTSADVGAEAYEQARHFRSVFSAASDCQILRSGLLAKLAEPTPPIAGAAQPPEAAPQEVKSEP